MCDAAGMAWPGGKDGSGVAQRLINEIPPHDVFVSAFLGDCAILRRKRPAALSIGIDLDRENVDRWASNLQDGAPFSAPLELYCCDAVEWLRFRFGWYRVAAAGVARSGDAGSGDAVLGGGADRDQRRGTGTYPGAAARKGGAAGQVAGNGDGRSRIFVYADPPYLMKTRSSKGRLYKHEPALDWSDEERWHIELLRTLFSLPCLVMVSHYPCELYDSFLAGWRHFTYAAQTRGGSRATEKVWCNYEPPWELHDPRYLGRNKREREKFRRRRLNLQAKIKRLPPHEQQSLLEALAAE